MLPKLSDVEAGSLRRVRECKTLLFIAKAHSYIYTVSLLYSYHKDRSSPSGCSDLDFLVAGFAVPRRAAGAAVL
jgi:hypothetical protein